MLELTRHCKKLREVEFIATNPPLSTSNLAIFKQIETLKNLSLKGRDWTSEHLAVISGFRNIQQLNINEHKIFTEGMFTDTPISKTLEKITLARLLPVIGEDIPSMLSSSWIMSNAALSCIAVCNNLKNIQLRQRFCDDAGLKKLAPHLPLLEMMQMDYNKDHIDGLQFFITQCKHLQTVFLTLPVGSDEEMKICRQGHLNELRSCFPHIQFY